MTVFMESSSGYDFHSYLLKQIELHYGIVIVSSIEAFIQF